MLSSAMYCMRGKLMLSSATLLPRTAEGDIISAVAVVRQYYVIIVVVIIRRRGHQRCAEVIRYWCR